MIAEELINQMIPALKLSDTAEKALLWMEELKTNLLPVIKGREFCGLISEDIILENNNLDGRIEAYHLIGENCYVLENQHLFDIIRISQDCDSEMVAILTDSKEFLGVSRYEDTLKAFSKSLAVKGTGGIVVLSLMYYDYSLSTITRLIEADNVKVLGAFVNDHPSDSNRIFLTLKCNKVDLTTTIATLERFDYMVVARFHDAANNENEKERLDNLLKYLDI
jgi:hypothetical protein